MTTESVACRTLALTLFQYFTELSGLKQRRLVFGNKLQFCVPVVFYVHCKTSFLLCTKTASPKTTLKTALK